MLIIYNGVPQTDESRRFEPPMSTTDELLANAEAYAGSFDKGDLPMPPARKIAVSRAWMRG